MIKSLNLEALIVGEEVEINGKIHTVKSIDEYIKDGIRQLRVVFDLDGLDVNYTRIHYINTLKQKI